MKIYPPDTLIANRYEVASRPLMGGMGIVYLCLDRQEDRPVALKTFKPEYLPDRAARDRFLREGTHWVDLGAHPHIVRCYAVERVGDGTEVYLVLELIAKEQGYPDASLRSWLIPGRPLPVETALLFALQIARGMQHATETIPGFVHRDLKPENVLVGADRLSGWSVNRLRITDFGLAGILQSLSVAASPVTSNQQPVSSNEQPATRTQLTHGIVGTPLYMAPEQWRGEPVGVYTDVYALGCILQEMLTGQRAAAGRSLAALQREHCTGNLRPFPGELPEEARALLVRCLALEPDLRYADWAAMEEELATALERIIDQQVPPPPAVGVLSREERVAMGWSYNEIGAGYADIGKEETAVGYFEHALAMGQTEGERALEGAALNNLGIAYFQLGEAWRAIGYYEQRLEITREIGDRLGEGHTMGNLGSAYFQLGDARRALRYHEQRLEIACETSDWRGKGNALTDLGLAYASLGNARRAIEYYEQALVIYREIDSRWGEEKALSNLGNIYRNLGDARQALGCYEKALAISREIGDRRGEGTNINNLGNAYAAVGDAQQAIECYEQALAIVREIGDQLGEGNALGNLGSVYLQLGDAQRALGFHEQALAIRRKIGDRRGEGTDLGNLGITYKRLGDARRAIGYYEQALVIRYEIGDLNGVASDSFNMAHLYIQQGEVARALPLAQEAARIFAQIGHAQYAQLAQALLAQLQGGGATTNVAQQAFEAFQRADSPETMQRAVAQFPLMTDPGFIAVVEQTIAQQAPPELKPVFEQRLAWLQQIANK